jgi:hypothetical protein
MKWAGRVACICFDMKRRLLGRHVHRWEANSIMDLKETGIRISGRLLWTM